MRSCSVSWILLGMVSFSGACAPTADNTAAPMTDAERAAIEADLVQMEYDWIAANESGDLTAFDRLFAEDFIYTTDDGVLHDRASFIALGEQDPVEYDSIRIEDMEVHWYGNTPVITGIGVNYSTQNGMTIRDAGRFTNLFDEQQGQWLVVVGHSAAVP
jgi:ketosteroid isomerase-like protein